MPFRYPTRIGIDRRSVKNPSFATPAIRQKIPARHARAAAREAARPGSPAESGMTVAATSGTNDESGPRIRIRDGPITA